MSAFSKVYRYICNDYESDHELKYILYELEDMLYENNLYKEAATRLEQLFLKYSPSFELKYGKYIQT